jgi:hypothetical protein
MTLFKKYGHPNADLMRACGQVTKWLHGHSRFPGVTLENLNLTAKKVLSVNGVVIANRVGEAKPEHLQRANSATNESGHWLLNVRSFGLFWGYSYPRISRNSTDNCGKIPVQFKLVQSS